MALRKAREYCVRKIGRIGPKSERSSVGYKIQSRSVPVKHHWEGKRRRATNTHLQASDDPGQPHGFLQPFHLLPYRACKLAQRAARRAGLQKGTGGSHTGVKYVRGENVREPGKLNICRDCCVRTVA